MAIKTEMVALMKWTRHNTQCCVVYDLHQGSYVFVIVCLLATLHKNFQTDLHEIFGEGWQWAKEQMIKFWWRSQTHSSVGGTDIVTLVRRALTEVCTVPVLLVVSTAFSFYGRPM